MTKVRTEIVRDAAVAVVILALIGGALFALLRHEPGADRAAKLIGRPRSDLVEALGEPRFRIDRARRRAQGGRVDPAYVAVPEPLSEEHWVHSGRVGLIVVGLEGGLVRSVHVVRS